MTSPGQIAECLAATLNADNTTRIQAELKLAEYLAFPEAGLALSQLVVAQDADIALRQHSASIALRKYVKERWSPYFPTFRGSAPPVEVKNQIRQAVFHGLSDPNRKIRSLCALTLSFIANSDWPDEYPDLLSSLIALISSNSTDSVHGAMQVFTEFIKADLTEDQILPVLRDLLPVLLGILGAKDVQSPLTRARAVAVFRQCVISLFMVKDQHPQAVKEAITSILPVWLEAFRTLLSIDPVQDVSNVATWDGLAVRIQIFKALDTINTSFPKSMAPFIVDLLNFSLSHLQGLYNTFKQYYISSSDPVPPSAEDESIELPQLISSILDFVAAIARGGRARDWFALDTLLPSLIAAVLNFTQMTDTDEDTWANNANAFVAQEDDETLAYSVRIAAFDLLGALIDRTPTIITSTFHTTLQNIIESSQRARDGGDSDWWRALEAALAAVGSQADSIKDCLDDEEESGRPKPIDIESLLTNVIPSALILSDCPFLQGRAFVFASQFAKLLPPQLAGQYLEAAIQVVESSQAGIPVKLSAVKAVNNFCLGYDNATLLPFMPRIAQDLGPFLLTTSEDTLSLVLETLSVVLEVDSNSWLTAGLANALVDAVLEVWSKNNRDPIFLSMFPDILKSLTGSTQDGIYETVIKQALPPLATAIGSASKDESWVASSAIDLVTSLVRGAPQNGLGEGFFNHLAPPLFKCLGDAEDRDVLQNGIICLTAVVRKDVNQLLSFKDESSRSGLDYVFALIARLLNSEDESGGLAIGDLVIHLLRRAGESVLPVLPELLQAMAARMLTAKTATFLQSLVIPFAFLINNQRDTILTLLESLNIEGRSGLDVVIQTWCENAETFQGFWPSRASTMGLTVLFISERPSLQALNVKGDIIVKAETKDVIMTRSRTKTAPHEFTSVPFPLKALKLLLHDVQSGGDSATIPPPDDVDSDDGDEDWSDAGDDPAKVREFEYLSDLIGPKGMAFDNDDVLEDEDDEDLKDDPISQMDMQAHIVTFMRECAARNTNNFQALVGELTTEETVVIHRIVSQ